MSPVKSVPHVLDRTTERPRAEAFLLKLSDALRALDDPVQIRGEACRLLGEHLGVNRVLYADISGEELVYRGGYVKGVKPLPAGPYQLAAFGAALIAGCRRGETVAIPDVASDPQFTAEERATHKAAQIAAC